MRLLVTILVIVGVVYGVYNFTTAAYAWFQVSNLVDEIARPEAAKLGAQQQASFGAFESRDRFGRIREGIMRGANDFGVRLRPEDVNVNVVEDTLDVRLSWEAPMLAYQGKRYIAIPMSVQRGFPIRAQ